MIRLNLLPHRELRRQAQHKEFLLLLFATALFALATWYGGALFFRHRITEQDARNTLLKNENIRLDNQIDEIKRLKEQTNALLARKRIVETLQTSRTETVKLIDQFAKIPQGIYLKAVSQTGEHINISGYTHSNARVSALMRDLEDSSVLGNPTLLEIKSVLLNNQKINEFSLNANLRQLPTDRDVIKPLATTAPSLSRAEASRQMLINKLAN